MFNPDAKISTLPIFEGELCYVIDNALAEPERWIARAAGYPEAFEALAGNAYPGIELHMPSGVTAALEGFLDTRVRHSPDAYRTIDGYSRLSMVTKAPADLEPRQWLCHRDQLSLDAAHRIEASLLYLFDNPRLGGTSFYAPTTTTAITERLIHDSGALSATEFSARYGLSAGYMLDSSAYFSRVLTVPAKFNRLLLYSGMVFHSSHIAEPKLLSTDPRHGRLTLNGFFTRQRLAPG
jgi:hypothetical protein